MLSLVQNTVAAFAAHGPASSESGHSVNPGQPSSRRVAALVEAARGDSTLESVLRGLGLVDTDLESARLTEKAAET